MTPFDAYKQYLALKNHFSKEKYDLSSRIEEIKLKELLNIFREINL